MIENIARHWAMADGRSRMNATVDAVAEVGNPTIIATLAVVAALLPMLFVSRFVRAYMAPIPINASAAMLLFALRRGDHRAVADELRFARDTLAQGAHDHAGGGELGAL